MKDVKSYSGVWVFLGEGAIHAGAVFEARAEAEKWIEHYRLTGTLTKYPINQSIYDWVIENGYWAPSTPAHERPKYIAMFSSAYLEHSHYFDGECH